jgi:Glycosyl transferase family 2
MTKIYGILVMRNEASRYLEKCLQWMSPLFDGLFVYDDKSSDDSVEIARSFTDHVVVRKDSPSFLEHEGMFRMESWRSFLSEMSPEFGDWVLSFDADEFLVSINETTEASLRYSVEGAKKKKCFSVMVDIPEIFKVEGSKHWRRTDGFWGQIRGTRLFEIKDRAEWTMKPMGCGSEPTYVSHSKPFPNIYDLNLMHYGYAQPKDVKAKYDRYSKLLVHGHNDSHIASIIESPTLEVWRGPIPEVGL